MYSSYMNPPLPPDALIGVEPLTYSVNEAAAVLGVSPATIYRLIYRRLLKPVPGLRHKRISKKQIYALAQGDGHRSGYQRRQAAGIGYNDDLYERVNPNAVFTRPSQRPPHL